jgi:hypothetical protein
MVSDMDPGKPPITAAALLDDGTRTGDSCPAARVIASADIPYTNIFIHKATSMNTLVEVMA